MYGVRDSRRKWNKHGRIRSKVDPFKIKVEQVMAQRVASTVLPKATGDIFRNLRNVQNSLFGKSLSSQSYGGFLPSFQPDSPITQHIKKRQSVLPIGDPKQQQEIEGPRSGVATPREQEETADRAAIDDSRMQGATLAKVLGSGMLSAAQLQAASFQNVFNMISVRTAANPYYTGSSGSLSTEEKREMTYMLQRMIVEGYAHGVDIPAMIKAKGGSIKIGLANWSGSGVGVGGGSSGSLFRRDYWNSRTDAQKMSLFFQEVNHGLGNMVDSDNSNPALRNARGFMEGVHDATGSTYEKYVDWMFDDMRKYDAAQSSLNVINASTSGRLTGSQVQAQLAQNPNWFPSLTGNIPNTPAAGGGTSDAPADTNAGTPSNPAVPQTISNSTTMNTFNPVNIPSMGAAPSIGGGAGTKDGGAMNTPNTPVAGVLPGSPGATGGAIPNPFAQGLMNKSSNNMLNGLAGALLR